MKHNSSIQRKGHVSQKARTPTRFDVITNVWGDSHVRLFLDLTLPNILSPRNLPALTKYGRVKYRIFCTPEARQQISTSSLGRRLPGLFEVEYVTPLGDRTPAPIWHVHWFHRSAAEAKASGSIAIFVPPDTLWSDGSFSFMGERLAEGYRGIACPFLHVTSETCLPAARSSFLDAAGILTIPPPAMWSFARQHLHPLQLLGMPGAPHARPVFELHWPVPEEGIVSRYAVREMTAFDATRCPITFLWNADGPDDAGLFFGTDVDDMFMLSVDPAAKYFQNYIIGHSAHPFDVARTTRHPLNENFQTRFFIAHSVKFPGGHPVLTSRWRKCERKAAIAARQVLVGRTAMQLYDALVGCGAELMAGMLSVALLETPLARRWRIERPITVVAPADLAFDPGRRNRGVALTACGREHDLVDFLKDHVLAGRLTLDKPQRTLAGTELKLHMREGGLAVNGASVVSGPIDLEGVQLFVVDKVFNRDLCDHDESIAQPSAKAISERIARIKSRIRRWMGPISRFLR